MLQADSLTRTAGATVSFIGAGADLDTTTNAIRFDAIPTGVVGGILPYASVGLDSPYDAIPETIDLVTDAAGNPAATPFFVGKVGTYDASNVKVTASTALSGTMTVGQGVLKARHNNALGSTAATTVVTGNLATLNATLINSASAGDTLTLSGSFQNAFPLTVTGPGDTTIAGAVSGTAGYAPGWREGQLSGYKSYTTAKPGGVLVNVPCWGEAYGNSLAATNPATNTVRIDDDAAMMG